MGHRSFDAQFKELREMLSPLARGFANFYIQVKTLCEAEGRVTSRIGSVEQTVNALSALLKSVNSLTARICKIDRKARGTYLDPVTAPQPLGPLGPTAQGYLMTLEIRDVDLTLSQALKMNMH